MLPIGLHEMVYQLSTEHHIQISPFKKTCCSISGCCKFIIPLVDISKSMLIATDLLGRVFHRRQILPGVW